MTAIVGVINAQGIAIAADSAVTISGTKGRKVYNNGNKIFTLSKYHPVAIAIYGGANFMGIPLESLIKMYRLQLEEKSFDKLEEYKLDFMKFLESNLNHVAEDFKSSEFFGFCGTVFREIKKSFGTAIDAVKESIAQLNDDEARKVVLDNVFKTKVDEYVAYVGGMEKSALVFDEALFLTTYKDQLDYIVGELEKDIVLAFPSFALSEDIKNEIRKIFIAASELKHIYEDHTGLIFVGFGDKEVYPSSQLVLVGTVVLDKIRHLVLPNIIIQPGVLNSNILPYVQGDVTWTVLTGIDPQYKQTVDSSITSAFKTISEEVKKKIPVAADAEEIGKIIEKTSKELITKLEDYKDEIITAPLLDILVHMGKDDMADLAESLVNITSLKRKFTSSDSSDESVGGPVDVAVITKGDGFIWMKRKHYFDSDLNKGFVNKYYK